MFEAVSPSHLAVDTNSLALPELYGANPSDRHLQRSTGSCRIVLSGSEKGNRIMDVYQQSPTHVLFPRTGGATTEEAVLINTAGGIAGGDRLDCSVTALDNASIAVTSQAAEKIYRALDEPARIHTTLKASDTARLAWLPQETIVFNWGRISRQTEIDLSPRAELLALESLVLGRTAHGEEVVAGHISDSWRVKRGGRLIWADTFRVTGAIFPHLRASALLSDCKAIATLIYFGPAPHERLEFFRDMPLSLGCHYAATSVGGLIIARFAATASSELRVALRSFLKRFSEELGPGPFRVPKMWTC